MGSISLPPCKDIKNFPTPLNSLMCWLGIVFLLCYFRPKSNLVLVCGSESNKITFLFDWIHNTTRKSINGNLHCVLQLVGIIHGRQHQQTQNDAPEIPTQLGGQIIS